MYDCRIPPLMGDQSLTPDFDPGVKPLSPEDQDCASTCSSDDFYSAFPPVEEVREWRLDWKKLLWRETSIESWTLISIVTFLGVFLGNVIMYVASTASIRDHRHATAIFPVCIPSAVALALACKWEGSTAIPSLVGFFVGQIYISTRNGSDILGVKLLGLLLISFIETMEAQVGAEFLRRSVARGKALPTVDSVHDAVLYSTLSFGISLPFETLEAIFRCLMGLTEWSSFGRFWSTKWLAVMAAFITISPAVIHVFDYVPKSSRLLKLGKIMEFLFLIASSVSILGFVTFSLPATTIIRPLPYLLYPLLIFSVFRFNRLGWTVVVAAIAIFGSWGSVHVQFSAHSYASGSSRGSSPMVIVQLELFMTVLGLVAIMLAGAVREKIQLTRDLHNMNQTLEEAVSKRTQELIKANMDLQISQARAEKANLAKSDFLANMSHEIRTPIHGILGLTALLLQTELSEDQLENLLSVKDCADLLLHIINSILDLAKIEAGRLDVEAVPFSVRKVVSGTLRMLQLRAKERGLRLLWKVDTDVPPIMSGDPGKVQQCILNLVGNALKFTHNGSVRVHVSLGTGFESSFTHALSVKKDLNRKSPKKLSSFQARLRSWASWPSSEMAEDFVDDNVVKTSLLDMFSTRLTKSFVSTKTVSSGAHVLAFSSELNGADKADIGPEYVLIEVSDTGIGISKDNVREMFNPFTQADASTSRLYGGTGLGLSIVHRFVELLGGKIWVESEIGRGSKFSFVVPFCRVGEELEKAEGTPPPSPARILQNSPSFPEKPPRAQKNSTLGKGRRAQSLSALMKNLKFTASPYSDVEPLLTGEKNNVRDSRMTQPPLRENSGIDDSEESEAADDAGSEMEPQTSHDRVTDAGTAQPMIEVSETAQAANFVKGYESHESSASSTESESPATGHGGSMNWESISESNDVHLRKDNSGAHDRESRISTDGPKGSDGDSCGDLEPRISDARLALGSSSSPEVGSVANTGDQSLGSKTQAKARLESDGGLEPARRHSFDEQAVDLKTISKGSLHVLLAEDNMINQRVATRQLQKHGHRVTIVCDGLQALNTVRLHHDKFDVVLMDIQMPNMDGLQATEKIRAEEAERGWTRLPVLGLTAHAISGYQEICLSHGMDAYLGKPFHINQLLSTIQKFV